MRCEPRVTRLASGSIVLSHRVGTTREGADGRPRLVRSDDGGATWRVLASPFAGALPAGWDLRGCALAELADGGLLAVVVALDKTSGPADVQPRDGGARPGPQPRRAIGRRRRDVVRALGAGRRPARPASRARVCWRSPTAASCARSRRSRPTTTRASGATPAALLRSDDGGRTWGAPVISAASDPDGDPARHDVVGPAHRPAGVRRARPVLLRLPPRDPDGGPGPHRVEPATMARPGPRPPRPGCRARRPIPCPSPTVGWSSSSSAAPRPRRWSRSSRTTAAGPSTETSECVVYEHVDASAPGADGSLSAFDYLMSMDRFTFGHPCGVVTGPNEALVFWYAGGPTRTSIRSARLRID